MDDKKIQKIIDFSFVSKKHELKALIDFDEFNLPDLENQFNNSTQESQLEFLKEFILFVESLPKNEDCNIPGLCKINIQSLYFL